MRPERLSLLLADLHLSLERLHARQLADAS